MKKLAGLFILLFFCLFQEVLSQEASPMQFAFIIKQVFPDVTNIVYFLPKERADVLKKKLGRAGAITKTKAEVYIIDLARDIGSSLKKLKPKTKLVIFDSPVLMNNKSKLYILKNCTQNNIYIFSSSMDYLQSGATAFIGKVDGKTKVIFNLKNYPELKSVLTPEKLTALKAELYQ